MKVVGTYAGAIIGLMMSESLCLFGIFPVRAEENKFESDYARDIASAAICAAEARLVAAHEGAIIDRQTTSVVVLKHSSVSEMSIGCPFPGNDNADLFVAWDGAKPSSAAMKVIVSAGGFVIGAKPDALLKEVRTCVTEALKLKNSEAAERNFQGVELYCHAFNRDGGGGSVTISTKRKLEPITVTGVDVQAAERIFGEPSNKPAEHGETWRVKEPSYGCKSEDDYSKLTKLILTDEQAARKFVTPRILLGDCMILRPGTVFSEAATSIGNHCVRKFGEPDCFFTARYNIDPLPR